MNREYGHRDHPDIAGRECDLPQRRHDPRHHVRQSRALVFQVTSLPHRQLARIIRVDDVDSGQRAPQTTAQLRRIGCWRVRLDVAHLCKHAGHNQLVFWRPRVRQPAVRGTTPDLNDPPDAPGMRHRVQDDDEPDVRVSKKIDRLGSKVLPHGFYVFHLMIDAAPQLRLVGHAIRVTAVPGIERHNPVCERRCMWRAVSTLAFEPREIVKNTESVRNDERRCLVPDLRIEQPHTIGRRRKSRVSHGAHGTHT